MIGRGNEVVKTLVRRDIDLCHIQTRSGEVRFLLANQ